MSSTKRALVSLALLATGCTMVTPHSASVSTSKSSGTSAATLVSGSLVGSSTTTDAKAAWSAVAPIFQRCAGCHNGVIQKPDLSTYPAVMASGMVIAGNSAGSGIYQVITGTSSTVPQMPPGAPLAASDIQAVAYWIQSGALLNAPTVIVAAPDPTTPTTSPTTSPVGMTQSVRVPDADTVAARLVMGLENHVTLDPKTATGKAYAAMYGSMPQTTDPNAVTGLDQVPLLVYTACASVTPTTYSIVTGNTATQNRAALIAAGLRMVNLHVGGMLTSDPDLNTQASAIFGTLVDQNVAAGASATSAFVSVCMAANTFGTVMKGF